MRENGDGAKTRAPFEESTTTARKRERGLTEKLLKVDGVWTAPVKGDSSQKRHFKRKNEAKMDDFFVVTFPELREGKF